MDSLEQQAARLAALEAQVARMGTELSALRHAALPDHRRASADTAAPMAAPAPPLSPPAERLGALRIPAVSPLQRAAERLYAQAGQGTGGAAISGDEIESLVGRYATLAIAALLLLMAVGVLIRVAVARGMLTPEVRVALGALTALVVGGAGLHFRHRGEVRYGDVLLSISLAIVDLVAWGAGPRLHLVTPVAALLVVDLVASGIALLALHDENEFLFAVAVGGALSAPFVTSDGGGTPAMLLSYGAVVLATAMRAPREAGWLRAFAVLVGGAAAYALAAAAMPVGVRWFDPLLVVGFAGVCALGALMIVQRAWRGDLARALLAVGIVGVAVAWDHAQVAAAPAIVAVGLGLALVTYAALAVREPAPPAWVASALLLPLVSLGVAYPTAGAWVGGWVPLGVWTAVAALAWQFERRRGELARGGAHLLTGGVLGTLAVIAGLWAHPLWLVVGLAGWGTLLAGFAGRESSPLPLAAVALALGAAGVSAIDQLASRLPYVYVPFWTRSSASAFVAAVALAVSSEMVGHGDRPGRGSGGLERWADRPLRLGLVIGFAILWGRMELAHAFSRDLATFLLILYYAACGLATLLAGRRLRVQRLRLAGLGLALYAALKAMMEVSAVGGTLLKVGTYMAVGLFLLGAGYLYRVRGRGGSGIRDQGLGIRRVSEWTG